MGNPAVFYVSGGKEGKVVGNQGTWKAETLH